MTKLTVVNEYEAKKGKCAQGQQVAALNIRKELKVAFPGIKFSVRRKDDTINIEWQDGPTRAQVEKIAGKYERGSFNIMSDIYENNYAEFNEKHGDTKYLFMNRTHSPNSLKIAGQMIAKKYAVSVPKVVITQFGARYDATKECVGSGWEYHWQIDVVAYRVLAKLAFAPNGELIENNMDI